MVTGIDANGKIRLSRQAVLEGWTLEQAVAADTKKPSSGGSRGGRGGDRRGGDRGGRNNDRGGDRRGGGDRGRSDRRS